MMQSAPVNRDAALQGDAKFVREFLARVRVRLATIAALEGAAGGLLLIALIVLLRWGSPFRVPVFIAVGTLVIAIGVALRVVMSTARRRNSALTVEHAAPGCHNLIVAAHEIMLDSSKANTPIAPLVFRQAATVARPLDPARLFPIKRASMWLGGSVGLLALLLTARNSDAATVVGKAIGLPVASNGISQVSVRVDAPAYTERAQQTLRDPARIEAIAGSRITVTVQSSATSVELETLDGKQPLVASGKGTWTGTVVATTDGFIALQPANNGRAGSRKLMGLSVTADRLPRVKLTAPGKDMLFPDANRSLNVAIEADDDLALSTLRLRYTKVSGSGERFTFTEGEVPIQTSRTSSANWKSGANWNLATLNLEPGDMVVYRAVATDKRPGAPPSESDSYIAEIRAIGSEAAAGFAIDPDEERYALSQQMVIMKTERLIAKRASMSLEAFADEASLIAVEQRRVRAEFVFMMGGELADEPAPDADMTMLDEHEEAEAEGDILDGRGANLGRVALQRAIRAMSSASTLLIQSNAPEALARERIALRELERAFSHTRIILRALNVQERLDLSRRMTGPLVEAGRDVRPVPVAAATQRIISLRKSLAGVATLMNADESSSESAAQAAALAETVLRIDASSKPMQAIAAQLSDAAAAFNKSRQSDAVRSLEAGAVALTAVLRAEMLTSPDRPRSLGTDRLSGAFSDALRAAQQKR